MFAPKAIYSLDPNEEYEVPIALDNDGETVSLLGV